jgi:hypothetical protein
LQTLATPTKEINRSWIRGGLMEDNTRLIMLCLTNQVQKPTLYWCLVGWALGCYPSRQVCRHLFNPSLDW